MKYLHMKLMLARPHILAQVARDGPRYIIPACESLSGAIAHNGRIPTVTAQSYYLLGEPTDWKPR